MTTVGNTFAERPKTYTLGMCEYKDTAYKRTNESKFQGTVFIIHHVQCSLSCHSFPSHIFSLQIKIQVHPHFKHGYLQFEKR